MEATLALLQQARLLLRSAARMTHYETQRRNLRPERIGKAEEAKKKYACHTDASCNLMKDCSLVKWAS